MEIGKVYKKHKPVKGNSSYVGLDLVLISISEKTYKFYDLTNDKVFSINGIIGLKKLDKTIEEVCMESYSNKELMNAYDELGIIYDII